MRQIANHKQAHIGPSGIVVKCPYDRVLITNLQDLDAEYKGRATDLWAMPLTADALNFLLDQDFELDDLSIVNAERFIADREARGIYAEQRRAWATSFYADPIPEVLAKLDLTKFTPAPFQWVPCYFARLTNGNFLLSDPMGAGKTIEATLVSMLPEYENFPVLIVCPANAVYNWQAELMTMFGFKSHVITKPLPYLLPRIRYYIVSYQMIGKAQFDDEMFLIVDESAEVKNTKAQRTKNLTARAEKCPHKMLMSGTPTPNRPEEAYSQIKILDPNFMPYGEFTKRFCSAKYSAFKKFGKDVSGHSNLGELHKLLYENYLVRREKYMIMPQLPKKHNQIVVLGEKSLEGESLMEMYSNNALLKASDQDFWEWVDLFIDCAEGEKILWFFHHQSLGEAFKQYFESRGEQYLFIDGGTDKLQRQKQVQQFQNDDSGQYQHFLLSLMAASTALTLTKAHLTVHAEMVFSPGVHAQASDRTHRMGQTSECQNYYPLLTKLEHRIWDIHVEKLSVTDQIYSGATLDDDGTDYSIRAKIAAEFNVPIMKRKDKKPVSSVMAN